MSYAELQPASTVVRDAPSWRRLLYEPATLISAIFLLALVLVAIFAPVLAPRDPLEQSVLRMNLEPSAEYWLGIVLLATHRPNDAEAYFQAGMSRSKRNGDADWRVARASSGLGDALYAQGRAREAEPHLVNGYRTVGASQHADARTREIVRERLVRFYTERRQPDKLQALLNGTLRVDADP